MDYCLYSLFLYYNTHYLIIAVSADIVGSYRTGYRCPAARAGKDPARFLLRVNRLINLRDGREIRLVTELPPYFLEVLGRLGNPLE